MMNGQQGGKGARKPKHFGITPLKVGDVVFRPCTRNPDAATSQSRVSSDESVWTIPVSFSPIVPRYKGERGGYSLRIQKEEGRNFFVCAPDIPGCGIIAHCYQELPTADTWVGVRIVAISDNRQFMTVTPVEGDLDVDLFPMFQTDEDYLARVHDTLVVVLENQPEALVEVATPQVSEMMAMWAEGHVKAAESSRRFLDFLGKTQPDLANDVRDYCNTTLNQAQYDRRQLLKRMLEADPDMALDMLVVGSRVLAQHTETWEFHNILTGIQAEAKQSRPQKPPKYPPRGYGRREEQSRIQTNPGEDNFEPPTPEQLQGLQEHFANKGSEQPVGVCDSGVEGDGVEQVDSE